MVQREDWKSDVWAEAIRRADAIQMALESAIAEWYLFAPDDPALDFGDPKNLHD